MTQSALYISGRLKSNLDAGSYPTGKLGFRFPGLLTAKAAVWLVSLFRHTQKSWDIEIEHDGVWLQ